MVWRVAKGFQVEGTATFRPSVVSFLLTLGARQWYIIGAYVPPNDVTAVHYMKQAMRAAPKGLEIVLMGNMNASLEDPLEEFEEDLMIALVDRGLVNTTDHFMP